jgi:hypothetical protein
LYSSIIYAASRHAVHVSILVAAFGVIALLLTRAGASVKRGR